MWSGDAEHGNDSFFGDTDFGDEGFDGGFAFAVAAAGDDLAEVGAEPLGDIGRGWCWSGADGVFKSGSSGGELGDLGAQRGEALPGGFFGNGAVLERGEVQAVGGLLA